MGLSPRGSTARRPRRREPGSRATANRLELGRPDLLGCKRPKWDRLRVTVPAVTARVTEEVAEVLHPPRPGSMSRRAALRRAWHPLPKLKSKERVHGLWQSEPWRHDQLFIDGRFNDPWNPGALERDDHPFGHRVGRRPPHGRLPLVQRQTEPPAFEATVDFALLHVHPSLGRRARLKPVSIVDPNQRRRNSPRGLLPPRTSRRMCLGSLARK